MNVLDALRNAIDFSRRDIIDILQDRTKINEAVKGIDRIVENDYAYSRSDKLLKYATQRGILKSSISTHSKAIKTAVDRSQESQSVEIDRLAADYLKTMQAECDEFKHVSRTYHATIKDEVDQDWGETRIFSRIDRSLAITNGIPNHQPTEYVEAKAELNTALNKREGRILTAISKTAAVEQVYVKLNVSVEKKQHGPVLHQVTGKQLIKALDAKYIELQGQANDLMLRNSRLNNITFIQNTAKNNLTKGDYKRLHDEARECKQRRDEAGYAERVQMIKMIDEKFITHPAIKELAVEMKSLETQYNATIATNNKTITSIQSTLNEIKLEKSKLKSLNETKFAIETNNLSNIINSDSYKLQLKRARQTSISI